jgi:hypothetical protein
MSLTPAYMFRGKTDCCGCGKKMEVNDQGIFYNVSKQNIKDEIQDLMFCVPCAWQVSHAVVADLVKLKNDESAYGDLRRTFSEPYTQVAKAINHWADIEDAIRGVTKNAVQRS